MENLEFKFGIPIKVIDPDEETKKPLLEETQAVAKVYRKGKLNNPWASNILSTFTWDGGKVNILATECKLTKSYIYQQVYRYLDDLQVNPPYSIVEIDESWLNYSEKGMYQEFHMHPEADISGTFYVDGDSDTGNIQFSTPAPAHNYSSLAHRSPIYGPQVSYKPYPGRLIIFPSYLEHMVQANNTDKQRISIAFNIKLVR